MRSASEKRVSMSFGPIELRRGGFFFAFRRWREGREPRENDSSRFESAVTSLRRIAGVAGAVSACSGAAAPSNFAVASMRRLRRPNGTSNSSRSASVQIRRDIRVARGLGGQLPRVSRFCEQMHADSMSVHLVSHQ